MFIFFSTIHKGGKRQTVTSPRIHFPFEKQFGPRTQAVVLLLQADIALPRRREHGRSGRLRAHRSLSLCAQSRPAECSPLCWRTLRRANSAPERASSSGPPGPPPPAAAAAARSSSLRGDGSRHRHGQRQRRLGVHRQRLAAVAQRAAPARAAQLHRQAAPGGHSV